MSKRLQDKVAIIAGAGSVGPGWGNGRATAVRFAEEGACVYAGDRNAESLVEDEGLAPVSGCDSEVLAQIVERADGDHVERVLRAVALASGNGLALMALWARPARMILVRRGNPVHWSSTKAGFYFASLAEGLVRLVDRSIHRSMHLDDIEGALVGAG